MPNFLLSVVIPSRNRQDYCIAVVRQVLESTSEQVEIVIQDNSDDDSLRAEIESINIARIIYNYEQHSLSFVDNFSKALQFAHGEYVCLIGDDDGILPNIEDAVKYARLKDLDALIPGINAVYLWPSKKPILKGAESGYLVVSYAQNGSYSINVRESLRQLLKQGCQDYQATDIPRLYHGLVHRRILEIIKEQLGTYFKGLTPDIYIALALGLTCNNVERFLFPITISGICPSSGSAASATGAHTGELKDAPHFKGHNQYEWNSIIPEIYTVETIWAETALHALFDMGQCSLVSYFNLEKLLSRIWGKYPQFRKIIETHAKKYKINKYKLQLLSITHKSKKIIARAWRRLIRKPEEVIKLYHIADIQVASESTMKVLLNKLCGFPKSKS